MKRIIRLTESDLTRIVRRVIKEQLDVDAVRSTLPEMMKNFQFNLDYFQKNPKGKIQMEANKSYPRILKINDIDLGVENMSNFTDYWRGDGQDFGRGFRSGNGMFNYNWDGSQLNITGGSGNEESCRPEYCYYISK